MRARGPKASTSAGRSPADARQQWLNPSAEVVPRGPLPAGVLVVERYLRTEGCREIVDYANSFVGEQAHVQDQAKLENGVYQERPSAERTTERVPLEAIAERVIPLFTHVFRTCLADFYDVEFDWFEQPQLLRYIAGGKYNRHADGERWEIQTRRWARSLDRDYSVLLYLNNEFTGGALRFSNHQVRIQPATGMLVAFPSDHRYIHAAEPVTAGKRYVLVSWATIRGSNRINPRAPSGAISLR